MAKKAALTSRQRQSQRIMREKAALKKRKAMVKKATLIGGGVVCVALMGGSIWAWKSGAAVRTANAIVDGAWGITAKAGFAVQGLYLEGRNRTSMEDIETAMGVKKGDPILQLSINDIRTRLESIESIKFAAVERALPGTLYVRIVEREPVALWQHHGKTTLVDDNGVSMSDIDATPYKNLPLIVGDDAPKHVDELLTILSSEPELARRFTAAIFVGERRWNVRLTGNKGETIEVKLPESAPGDAWKKLASLQAKERVLDRAVRVIDLRLTDKMFIKLAPETMPGKAANARET